MKHLIHKLNDLFQKLDAPVFFLLRLVIGVVFVQSGYGKLINLDHTIEFFTSIGIPAAQIQAPFAAATELVCGFLVLIGLYTRFASLPLIVVMMVAIRTAKWDEVTGIPALFGISEFLYIVILLALLAKGASYWSFDSKLKNR